MKSAVLVSSIALLSFVGAYDFDNLEYNQILAGELEDLEEENNLYPTNPRHRRDGEISAKEEKCRRKHIKSCCEEEFLQTLKDEDKILKKECYREITGKNHSSHLIDPFRCENIEEHKRDITCIRQCVMRKRGLVDDEDNFKIEEMTKYLNEKLSSHEWLKQQMDVIINKCVTEANETDAKREKDDKGACSPAAIKLGHCFWREIQIACPTNLIKDERKCNKIREEIKKKDNLVFDE